MKTVKFFTLGCKVNQYETQALREQVISSGFSEAAQDKKADLYIINSCTVTHRADSDSLGFIHRAKRENPAAKIIFTGCLVELDAKKIKEYQDGIFILKNSRKEQIADYLPGPKEKNVRRPAVKKGISFFENHTRAFLKIQDGCNNRCAYCKVPLVRGRSRSKPLAKVIEEAHRLVSGGIKEIVLCGICLGSFGKDLLPKQSLAGLVNKLEDIEGLLRIRLSSIEARDVTAEVIAQIARKGKLCPHLHIPIQSGDNRILKAMNRTYTRQGYLKLIKGIRARIPGVAITTDVMVGFPGETEAAFKNTLALVKEVSPLRTHIFPYSPRPGTKAAGLADSVPSEVKKIRAQQLRKVADECASRYKQQFFGKEQLVLFEEQKRSNNSVWAGYSSNYLRVEVSSTRDLKNTLIPVKIMKIEEDSLKGRLIQKIG